MEKPATSKEVAALAAAATTAQFIKAVLLCALLLWSTPVWAQETVSSQDRKWFASTDPKGKNDDYLMLKPGETRRIPLAGGTLQRLWSTAFEPEKITLRLSGFLVPRTTRSPEPAPMELLSGGRVHVGEFHEKAYTLYNAYWLTNNANLIVTNHSKAENKFYYQVTIASRVNSKSFLSSLEAFPSTNASKTISGVVEPDSEIDLELSQLPQGFVRSLEFAVDPATLDALRDLRLQATWEANGARSLDVPLSALAGQFFNLQKGSNYGSRFDGKTLRLNWFMPYAAGARLALRNSGRQRLNVKVTRKVTYVEKWPEGFDYRFCAAYGSARTQKGKPLEILNVQGKGAFIGLNLAIAPVPETRRFSFAYLEGNEIITADGKKFEGTGTEDFFDSAWYFPEKPYTHPYAGMTYKGKEPPKISMYRLMLADAVPFAKSLKFELGHGSSNNSDDLEYHWVAFWYQEPPLKFQISDELKGQWGASSAGRSTPGAEGEPSMPWFGRVVFLVFGAGLFVLVVLTLKRVLRRPS